MGNSTVDKKDSTHIYATTRAEFDKKQQEQIEKARVANTLQNGLSGTSETSIANNILEVNSTRNNKITWGELGMTSGSMAAFCIAPEIVKTARSGKDVKELFRGQDKFVSEYTDLASDTKKLMRDYEKLYRADMKSKDKNIAEQAKELYNNRIQALQKACKETDLEKRAQEIANLNQQVKAEMKVGNRSWFKRIFRGKETAEDKHKKFAERTQKANEFNDRNAEFNKGIKFKKPSLKGTGMMAGLTLLSEAGNVIGAYQQGTEYGNKQLVQSSVRTGVSLGVYAVGDSIGQYAGQKLLKGAATGHRLKAVSRAGHKTIAKVGGKVAVKGLAKLAVKGGCKALGTAIGSVVPGLGNIIGFAVGCALDLVISKCVLPKIKYFQNDAIEEASVKNASKEQQLSMLEQNFMQDKDIDGSKLGRMRYNLEKNCTEERYAEMNRIRNITDSKQREEAINKYFETYYPSQQLNAVA